MISMQNESHFNPAFRSQIRTDSSTSSHQDFEYRDSAPLAPLHLAVAAVTLQKWLRRHVNNAPTIKVPGPSHFLDQAAAPLQVAPPIHAAVLARPSTASSPSGLLDGGCKAPECADAAL